MKSYAYHPIQTLNTYFYNNTNGKIGNKLNFLYSNKISTIPLALSAFGLLLVLGLMISPSISTGERMFGGDKVYAEEGASNEPVPYTVPPDDGVSLTINTPLPDDEVIEKQVSGSGAKYITVDFTVGAHNVDDYKVYVQADSATLTGKSYSDTITTINAPTTATEMNSATKKWGYAVAEGQNVSTDSMTFNTIQTSVSTPAASVTGENGAKILNHTQPYTLAFAANLDGAKADHYRSNITLSVAAGAEEVMDIPGLGFAGVNYMQDMNIELCRNARTNTSGRLIDSRDDKVYWVGKLRDGNCWMTQNLSFDPTGKTLTSSDSDVKNDTVLVKSSSWSATNAASINWEISSAGSGHSSYGGYYSWQAATANTGTSDPGGVSGSICPKAWRLPHSGTIGSDSPSFIQLISGISYGSALVSSPYYFVYGGYIDGGLCEGGVSNGYYWSAMGNNTPNAFYLNISSTVSVTNDRRTYGMFVRCVAR